MSIRTVTPLHVSKTRTGVCTYMWRILLTGRGHGVRVFDLSRSPYRTVGIMEACMSLTVGRLIDNKVSLPPRPALPPTHSPPHTRALKCLCSAGQGSAGHGVYGTAHSVPCWTGPSELLGWLLELPPIRYTLHVLYAYIVIGICICICICTQYCISFLLHWMHIHLHERD